MARANESKPIGAPPVKEDNRGRRPTYNDPKTFNSKVDEYFKDCDEKGIFPDEKGMFVFMDIFEEEIDALISPENKNADKYLRVLKRAQYRRESWLARNMVANNKISAGCMNALKQEQNGGYRDRASENKTKRVQVIMPDGMSMDLFK